MEGERIAVAVGEPIRPLVPGSPHEAAHAPIVLPVGVRELDTRATKLSFDLLLRIPELSSHLIVGELGQSWVRHAVRTHLHTALRVRSKLIPAHGRELLEIVALELRDRQGRAVARVTRADEELKRNTHPFERRKDARRTAKRIVEGRAHAPEAGEHTDLTQEQIRLDAEAVLPRRRDRVVADD